MHVSRVEEVIQSLPEEIQEALPLWKEKALATLNQQLTDQEIIHFIMRTEYDANVMTRWEEINTTAAAKDLVAKDILFQLGTAPITRKTRERMAQLHQWLMTNSHERGIREDRGDKGGGKHGGEEATEKAASSKDGGKDGGETATETAANDGRKDGGKDGWKHVCNRAPSSAQ